MSSVADDSEPDEARPASEGVSAQAIKTHVRTPWRPDPVRQQRADYTIEDVLALPPGAPRVELSHGVMLVVPSPTESHQIIGARLWNWLDTHGPERYRAVPAIGVAVARDHTLEPDVLLRYAEGDVHRHFVSPNQVVLVIEVVSPGTRVRDRLKKPAEYAAAGIPFYWRIEQDPIRVHAYRRLPNGSYERAGDSADTLELDEPFPLKLSIAEITP